MTDGSAATETDVAERLARLQARRSSGRASAGSTTRATGATGGPASTATSVTHPADPAAASAAGPAGRTRSRRRRRSPAATAKIVTVGASTTAVLGLIAGYGYAEGRPEGPELVEPPSVPDEPAASAQLPVAPAAASTPASPQVIVVLVDRSTGEQLATVPGATREQAIDQALDIVGDLGDAAPPAGSPVADDPAAAVTAVPASATEVVVAEPAPVPVPTAVDLAVPVPPPPPPAPAMTSAPSPAPSSSPSPAATPQATSGGS